MAKFFKGTEKRPFGYPTIIEERKGSTNYFPYFIGVTLIIIVAAFLFFVLR